ncbi:MAG: hypothetical protein WKF80_07115, partial [Thermomicrobiales bacterium]
SEWIVTVMSRTPRRTGDRRSSAPSSSRGAGQNGRAGRDRALGATTEEVIAEQTLQATAA